jgi:hypothetical protein
MAAKQTETAPADQPGQATAPADQAQGKKITKHEAVRRALATLGQMAMPLDIQRFVKEQFGLDMTTDHISVSKGKILHERPRGKTTGKKKPAPKQTAPEVQRQPAAKTGTGAGTISLQDIATVKDLLRRVGGGELRSLVELLDR